MRDFKKLQEYYKYKTKDDVIKDLYLDNLYYIKLDKYTLIATLCAIGCGLIVSGLFIFIIQNIPHY